MEYLGIIFALVALVSWGLGDFFIQRTSRKTGIVDAMFFIDVVAAVVLLPFIWDELPLLEARTVYILLTAGVVLIGASFFLFTALKKGKLSVVEPTASLELPFTVIIAALLGHERLDLFTYLIIALVFIGIFLTVTEGRHVLRNLWHGHIKKFERGVWLAFFGSIAMALGNFTVGFASQETSPLMTIWATSLIILIPCVIYYIFTNRFGLMVGHIKKYPLTVLAEVTFDNMAWIAFAFAVVYIPISVAITISESYIILAVLLGVLINKEKLRQHQYLGVAMAIGGVLLLARMQG
ncbi:DMT family transporter [bacterium]|nr:MAG: DMT family transporter [bacterium]